MFFCAWRSEWMKNVRGGRGEMDRRRGTMWQDNGTWENWVRAESVNRKDKSICLCFLAYRCQDVLVQPHDAKLWMHILSSAWTQWTCGDHNLVPIEIFKRDVQWSNFTKGKKIHPRLQGLAQGHSFFLSSPHGNLFRAKALCIMQLWITVIFLTRLHGLQKQHMINYF